MLGRLRHAAWRVKTTPRVQAVVLPPQSLVAFNRGRRYARELPEVAGDPGAERPTTPLEEYFDAHTEGPGLWKWRHYFEIYERHLARFRGQPVRVLEVGVFAGGGLQMWRDYFGPDCQMHGVDIDPSAKAHAAENVSIHLGDQADGAFWARFLQEVPQIDVVLDDGGHQPHQQIATFEALLPHIAPGGVYLCEDIHRSMQPFHSYIDGFTRPLSEIPSPFGVFPPSPVHQHVASVHRYPLVTVVEKPAHRVPAFEAPQHGSEWPEGSLSGQ